MNQTYMGWHVTNLIRYFSAILIAIMLSACGGGGGSSGSSTAGGSASNGKISIALTDQVGVPSNVIAGTNALLVKATVLNKSGGPAVGVVVTFSIDTATAALSPASGTALTDSDGVAKMSLSPGVGTGAGTVTASAIVVGTTTISTFSTFSVSAPPAAIPQAINFVSAIPNDKSIVIKGAGGNGRSEVAILTFSVIDSSNTGIPNLKVNFTYTSTKAVTLSASYGITDSSGKVTVALSSGTDPTSVRVIATVDSKPNVGSVSDTITITTGAPVQTAMSVSLSAFFAEGINFDGVRVVVQGRLADAFGGAVADGTQLVFTTDVGSVAGIGGAQCLTNGPNITTTVPFPGFCEIIWSSQNPRGNGVANIVVTATSGTASLSQSVKLYVLGSYANIYEVDSASFEGSTTRLSPANQIGFRDFTGNCAAQRVYFEIVDINENPMPPASVIAVTGNGAIAVGVPSPNAVPMWSTPVGLLPHRGTIHSVLITPPGSCNTAGGTSVTDSFDIKVTTPKNVVSLIRVFAKYNK